MKLYSSFDDIISVSGDVEDYFRNNPQYLAHSHKDKDFETLYNHTVLVKVYFGRLIKINQLDSVVDKLLSRVSFDNSVLADYMKNLFVDAVIFHDVGKVNPNFQALRMGNEKFSADDSLGIGYKHSFLSTYAFISYHLNKAMLSELSQAEKAIISPLIFLFSIPILKHHSSFIDKDYSFEKERIKEVSQLVDFFDLKFTFDNLLACFEFEKIVDGQSLWSFFENEAKNKEFDYFAMYALLKLNYSLLTAADYYATSDFSNGLKFEDAEDFGLITQRLREELITNFDSNDKYPYNGELIDNYLDITQLSDVSLQSQSNSNLNQLRMRMGADVLCSLGKSQDKKVFYIEAPTGGGKTNMSLIAVRKLIETCPDINKVFYVFPFTTLITQTHKLIKDVFRLTDQEIAVLHSKAGFQVKRIKDDATYGSDRRNQIDNLFVNYPISLMTHIKFFDILKSNRKDINYLLHRLANSVVVIDELQAYDPKHWDKIKFFISQYSELFNIRFIVMSATLPKIDRINTGADEQTVFTSLIPNAKKYLQNPNFSKRVSIKTDLLKSELSIPELVTIVEGKSDKYALERFDSYRGSVYTIVEFIFKKSATEFFQAIKESSSFDEVFLLSGSIVEPRRRYIIEYLKDADNRKKRILLVTTQVVEAGVDIDMDLGFKNQSLIDSDEQLAGRINRNVKKQNCELWLFKYNEPKRIYGKDLRYKKTLDFSPEFIEEILTEKSFDKLYEKVFEDIDLRNRSEAIENFRKDYLNHFSRFDFKSVNEKFKLIECDNGSLFIPLDIPLNCYGKVSNFSDYECSFLERRSCIENNKVVGEKIWDLYIDLIRDKAIDFTIKKKDLLILNGIMSKFTISIFATRIDDFRDFLDYNEDTSEYRFSQYLKLSKANIGSSKLYDFKSGINESLLTSSFEMF